MEIDIETPQFNIETSSNTTDFDITVVPGAAATVQVGSTSTGSPGSAAAVSNSGTPNAAVLDFTIPQGPTGPAATVAVGTVTTGAAGTQAAVSNSGSSGAAVLNFTIPRGQDGEVTLNTAQTLTNKTLTNPRVNNIRDLDGANVFAIPNDGSPLSIGPQGAVALQVGKAASAVNYVRIVGAASGSVPYIQASGSDTNVSLYLMTKGSGTVKANGVDVVTTTGTQALTNKTLTSPTITNPTITGTNFIQRSISTATGPVMLGSSQATDYVTFARLDEAVALLHLDGASGSTTITDSGRLAANWTAAGNAQISTAQSVSGGASLYLDGSGDYITPTADPSVFAFGTGDFTLEAWIRPEVLTGSSRAIFDFRPAGISGAYICLRVTPAGEVKLFVSDADRIASSTGVITINTWHHIALARSSGVTKLFVDGTQVGSSYTDANSYLCGSGRPHIGADSYTSNPFYGWIDGVRILNGHCAYTGTFTPPVRHGDRFEDASTAVNTVALLHCDGASGSTTITDSGVLQANWTASGNAQISTAQSKFGGSSIYFDGTGDRITPTADASNFAFGTGDFTIEMWCRLSSMDRLHTFYDGRNDAEGLQPYLRVNSSNVLLYTVNGVNRITGPTVAQDTWYHVAVARSGSSTRMFLDGTQVGSTWTDTTDYANSSGRPYIGSAMLSSNVLHGYLQDIRITKGLARYTSNFTPPTSLLPDVPVIGLPSAASNSNRYTIMNKGTIPILSAASVGTQTIDGTTTFEIDTNVSQEFIPVNSSWSKV